MQQLPLKIAMQIPAQARAQQVLTAHGVGVGDGLGSKDHNVDRVGDHNQALPGRQPLVVVGQGQPKTPMHSPYQQQEAHCPVPHQKKPVEAAQGLFSITVMYVLELSKWQVSYANRKTALIQQHP